MTPAEAKDLIDKLRAEITKSDELYYGRAKPETPDFEYDQKKHRLAELEAQYPQFATADSPTKRIGDDRTEGFTRVKHRQAMTTLENTYNKDELWDFDVRLTKQLGAGEPLQYSIEPKVDGASISLTYENGRLVRAVTRGDGEEGDDVTDNVRGIAGLPTELTVPRETTLSQVPALVEVRGEVFMEFDEFNRLNKIQEEAGLEPYANPRNLAAGTLKLLDAEIVAARRLRIVVYGLGACEPHGLISSQKELHAALAAWGLPGLQNVSSVQGFEAVWSAIGKLDVLRSGLPYATDGAVVKLDEFRAQEIAGFRGEGQSGRKLSPRWACAYKFAPERAETQLRAITIQVGRTGVLTPVAELDPVLLAGTTVARATLHNKDEIARKDIRVGDYVLVEKAGEIIPAVIEVNLQRRTPECKIYEFPDRCPVCSTLTVRLSGEVAIRCPNINCPAQLVGRLDYVASRSVLDLEGLGGVVAERLVESGWVHDFFDLFGLDAERLAKLTLGKTKKILDSGKERKLSELGESNAQKIVNAIARARTHSLARWILAMQIRDVGGATAQDLEKIHGSMDAIAESVMLRDIAEFGRLSDEMAKHSPTSKENRQKTEVERTEMKPLYEDYKRRADEMGLKLVAAGYAKLAEKPLHESILLGESAETFAFQAMLTRMAEHDSDSKENKGKSGEERKELDRQYADFKKQADDLAKRMIARGQAKRATRPPRDALPVLGPVAAQSIVDWIESPHGKRFLLRFKEFGIKPGAAAKALQGGTPFSSKTVVLTGTLTAMTRPQAQDKIRLLGGSVVGKVSSKTDFVVAGGAEESSKLKDARKLGVRVLSEDEFLSMLPAEPQKHSVDSAQADLRLD